MRLLLDTHVLLWCLEDSRRLSAEARRRLREADAAYVSAASLWEIAIKADLGRIRVDMGSLTRGIRDSGFLELPVTWRHASAVRGLPSIHRDPFDRMLVAQAVSEPLILLTHDRVLRDYTDLVVVV